MPRTVSSSPLLPEETRGQKRQGPVVYGCDDKQNGARDGGDLQQGGAVDRQDRSEQQAHDFPIAAPPRDDKTAELRARAFWVASVPVRQTLLHPGRADVTLRSAVALWVFPTVRSPLERITEEDRV
jgi:hypothetical protein